MNTTTIKLENITNSLLEEIKSLLLEKKVVFSVETSTQKAVRKQSKAKQTEKEAFLHNAQQNASKIFAKYL